MRERFRVDGSGPVVVTLAVLLVTAWFVSGVVLGAMRDIAQDMDQQEIDLGHAAHIVPPLVIWGLGGIVVVTTLTLACVLAVGAMRSALRGDAWVRAALCWGVPLVAVGVAAMELSGPPIFSDAYKILSTASGVSATEALPEGLHGAARVMGSFGIVATIIVGTAAAVLCHRSRDCGEQDLTWRVSTLRLLLYTSAVGLAAGTLTVEARLTLQIPADLEEAALAHATDVVSAASLGYGGVFTLFLVAVFLPASRVLGAAGARLYAADDEAEQTRDEWLSARGLKTRVATHIAQVVAALAPLLAHHVSSGLANVIGGVAG